MKKTDRPPPLDVEMAPRVAATALPAAASPNRHHANPHPTASLRDRIRNFVSVDAHLIHLPPKKVTKELASLEGLVAYRRWLRGVLALLSLLSFVLCMVDIEMTSEEMGTVANMILCFFGIFCVLQTYSAKALYAGLLNPLYSHHPSLLHSPYLGNMLVEVCLWVHTPPFVVNKLHWDWADNLDFIAFVRLYNLLLYWNETAFLHRTFCRAMSALCDIKINTAFFLRTSMIYHKTRTSFVLISTIWGALALVFSKAETRSMQDSVYFVFVTAATIGYGDISPITPAGRVTAFLAWVVGLVMVGWVVSLVHGAMNLNEYEKNLYVLFRANELSRLLREESAKTIQRAFRLHRSHKRGENSRFGEAYAVWALMRQCYTTRRIRSEFRADVSDFNTACAGAEEREAFMTPSVGRSPTTLTPIASAGSQTSLRIPSVTLPTANGGVSTIAAAPTFLSREALATAAATTAASSEQVASLIALVRQSLTAQQSMAAKIDALQEEIKELKEHTATRGHDDNHGLLPPAPGGSTVRMSGSM